MSVLFPLFLKLSPFWSRPEGLEIVKRRLQWLDSLEGFGPPLVATDMPEIEAICRQLSITNLLFSTCEEKDIEFLPPGTSQVAEHLPASDDPWLVLDYRNLSLEQGILDGAWKTFHTHEEDPLLSVSGFDDHPCQYFQYLRTEDMGFLALAEEKQPEFLDLPQFPQPSRTALLRSLEQDTTVEVHIQETEQVVVIPREVFPPNNSEELILKGIPYGEQDLYPDQTFETTILNTEKNIYIKLGATCSGFVWTLVRNGQEGPTDFREPLREKTLPWDIQLQENHTFRIQNKKTNEQVGRRQVFYPLLRPEGSIFVMLPGHASLIHSDSASKLIDSSRPFEMNNFSSIKVYDHFDYCTWLSKKC